MNFVKDYVCTLCHKHYDPLPNLLTCPDCGEVGILEIEYDYQAMKQVVNKAYFHNNKDFSMWRYLPMMSLNQPPVNPLKVGWTPLYPSNRLHQAIGIKTLYIKDEGLNPTASLKDRASAVAVQKAIELGETTIACSSTGNAASSLAGNAARMGLKSVIFVPKRAPIGKLTQLLIFGATVISVEGDYKDAFNLSKKAINHYGWYNRNAAINPHLVEGKKTVALEIAEQLDFKPTDWVVVSVGDGCTVAGVYKGFYDLFQLGLISKIPKILGVQAEGCAPFVEASLEHRGLQETEELSIADSIAVGIPRNPTKAIHAIEASKGAWIAVSDQAILSAMALLGKTEGIFGEPAGVAGLAGLMKALNTGIIQHHESATILVTGNGLKDTVSGQQAINGPIRIKPDLSLLIEIMNEKTKEV